LDLNLINTVYCLCFVNLGHNQSILEFNAGSYH